VGQALLRIGEQNSLLEDRQWLDLSADAAAVGRL
jgi:hypothetical protein